LLLDLLLHLLIGGHLLELIGHLLHF